MIALPLDRQELVALRKELVAYQFLLKHVGRRAQRVLNQRVRFEVWYPATADIDFIQTQAVSWFQQAFGVTVSSSDIVYTVKQTITGGVRLFHEDHMYDMTFDRFQQQLKN